MVGQRYGGVSLVWRQNGHREVRLEPKLVCGVSLGDDAFLQRGID